MRIVSRYIFREIATFFSISVLAFTGILLTLRMLRFAALIVNRGVSPYQIAQIFVAIIPTFLEIALPLAALLGVMLAFARLSGDSEIVVMRASGISIYQFIRPVLIFAITATAVSFYVSLVLRPWGFRTLSTGLFEIAKSKSTSGLNEGIFNKLGDITLYAEQIDYSTGNLKRVIVDDKRDDAARKVVIARGGRIVSDEANQTITLVLTDGTAHELTEGNYVTTRFNTNSILVDPEQLFKSDDLKKGKQSRELDLMPLKATISNYREAIALVERGEPLAVDKTPELDGMTQQEINKKYRRFKIEFGQRFSLPCASFLMAFVGMALGIQPPRAQKTWGAGISATLGMLVFVVYYGVFSLGLALAESGAVKIWIALWLPNVIAAGCAAFMIQRLASEKWHSIAEMFQSFGRFLPKFGRSK